MSSEKNKKQQKNFDATELHFFSARLRWKAEECGENPASIAKALNINRQSVDHWFKGRNFPGAVNMKKLAEFLKVSVSWLKHGEDFKEIANPYFPGSKPGRGSTILTGRISKYGQPDDPIKTVGEREGLHSRTKHVEIDGVKLAISKYEDPMWIHNAIEEILQSGDTEVILALEANVRVFLEKVRKERGLSARIEKLELEIKKHVDCQDSSPGCLTA